MGGTAPDLADAWTGDRGEANAYLAWLHVVASRLVSEFWLAITAMSIVLYEREVLTGEEAVEIVRNAR